MAERIDAFAHWLPETTYEAIAAERPDGSLASMPEPTHFWDIESRLADMDEFGIDKQVLTFTQHDLGALSPDDALPIVEEAHDELHRVAGEHPDRFVPVATLPFYTDEHVAEVERALTELDMAGVQVFTHVGGRLLDDEAVFPAYELAQAENAPVWIHPRTYPGSERTRRYTSHKMLGWPFETSLAMVRLVLSGVLDRFPELDVVTHHAGGMIPYFAERIQAYYRKDSNENWVDLEEPVTEYLRRFYADSMIHGDEHALDLAHEFFGDGRLLFASDYPFGPDRGRDYMRISVDGIERMSLGDDERAAVYGDNVAALLGA